MLNKLIHLSKAIAHQLLFNPACSNVVLTKYKNYKLQTQLHKSIAIQPYMQQQFPIQTQKAYNLQIEGRGDEMK